MRRSFNGFLTLIGAVALLAATARTIDATPRNARTAAMPATAPSARSRWVRTADLSQNTLQETGGRYHGLLPSGEQIALTVNPQLQDEVEETLSRSAALYRAAVLVSVSDGKILSMAGSSTVEPNRPTIDFVAQPWAPAASIFKLVTASALLRQGVAANRQVCYHDGIHSLEAGNLTASRLDRSCASFAYGLAKSQNAIIGRLAYDHLRAAQLRDAADSYGWGKTNFVADLPVVASEARIPEAGSLAFARVAAGFWSTTLSPLHGAYVATTIARGGNAIPLHFFEADDASVNLVSLGTAERSKRVLPEIHTQALSEMMVSTTEMGTARHGFHDARTGRKRLGAIRVAGKTGTLNRPRACAEEDTKIGCKASWLGYSWFVGFAPANRPQVAVSVLLGNGPKSQERAHQVAANLLAAYFRLHKPKAPATLLTMAPTKRNDRTSLR